MPPSRADGWLFFHGEFCRVPFFAAWRYVSAPRTLVWPEWLHRSRDRPAMTSGMPWHNSYSWATAVPWTSAIVTFGAYATYALVRDLPTDSNGCWYSGANFGAGFVNDRPSSTGCSAAYVRDALWNTSPEVRCRRRYGLPAVSCVYRQSIGCIAGKFVNSSHAPCTAA